MSHRLATRPVRVQCRRLPIFRLPGFLALLDFFRGFQAPHPRDVTPPFTIAYAAALVKQSRPAPGRYPPPMRR